MRSCNDFRRLRKCGFSHYSLKNDDAGKLQARRNGRVTGHTEVSDRSDLSFRFADNSPGTSADNVFCRIGSQEKRHAYPQLRVVSRNVHCVSLGFPRYNPTLGEERQIGPMFNLWRYGDTPLRKVHRTKWLQVHKQPTSPR